MSGIGRFKRIALDSNIFIYYFENNPQFINKTSGIFEKLSKNRLQAVTSVISIIESLSYPLTVPVIDGIKQGFATAPNLTVFEVSQEIAIEAARIRREYGLRLPDSVQLATALAGKAQAFITNDDHLKSFKEVKIIPLSHLKE